MSEAEQPGDKPNLEGTGEQPAPTALPLEQPSAEEAGLEAAPATAAAPSPPPPERQRRGWIAPAVVAQLPAWFWFLFAVGLVVWAQAWFMFPAVWLNMDEGDIGAIAIRMIEGRWLPYVDGVSHRGPMLYWVTAAAMWLFGREWWVIRLLSFAIAVWVPVACMWAAVKVKRPVVGAVAAIVWAWLTLVMWEPVDGSAFNGEYLLNAFALAALVTAVLATRLDAKRPRFLFFLTGVFVALATLSKQVGGVLVPPFLVWAFAAEVSRPRAPGTPRRHWTLSYLAGGAMPTGLIVLRYVAEGEFATFWYYLVTYNAKVYLAPHVGRESELFFNYLRAHQVWFGFGATVLLAVVGSALARGRRGRGLLAAWDANGFEITVALTAVASAMAANASLRSYGHYFLQYVPWAGLLMGLVVARLIRAPQGLRSAAVTFVVLAPGALTALHGWSRQHARFVAERAAGRGWEVPATVPMCRYLNARTKPEDPLFIWGFRCQWYISCHRVPATRFVFTTFPAGVVPWYPASPEVEEQRTVPGSKELLLAELEATKPPVVIDVGGASMLHRSMLDYPKLAAWLNGNYCPDGKVEDALAYVRKNADGSCPAPAPW